MVVKKKKNGAVIFFTLFFLRMSILTSKTNQDRKYKQHSSSEGQIFFRGWFNATDIKSHQNPKPSEAQNGAFHQVDVKLAFLFSEKVCVFDDVLGNRFVTGTGIWLPLIRENAAS